MSVEDRQAQVKAQREALRAAEDEALGEYDAETLLELERDPLLNALLSGAEGRRGCMFFHANVFDASLNAFPCFPRQATKIF